MDVKEILDKYDPYVNCRYEHDLFVARKNKDEFKNRKEEIMLLKDELLDALRKKDIDEHEAWKEKQMEIREEFERKQDEEIKKEKEMTRKTIEKAIKTGKPQFLFRDSWPCDDPDEQCDVDIVSQFAMPDGSIKLVVEHTW